MAIKKGDKVKVEYTGTLDDGTVFDSSEKHGKPLEFEVGHEHIIKGFSDALIGMNKDEEKSFKLESKDAYGESREDLIKKIPKDQLPKEQDPKPGMVLVVTLPDGNKIPAVIKEADDKEVTLDLNHPLAGKTLNFKIKVLEC